MGKQQQHPVLDPGQAVGAAAEIAAREGHALGVGEVAVIGRHRVDVASCDTDPQLVLLAARAQRRAEQIVDSVLPVVAGIIQKQILRAGLHPDSLALTARQFQILQPQSV